MPKKETNLGYQIRQTEHKTQYDSFVKRILSDKQVLARILIGVVPEFEGYSVDDAISCIESEPRVESVEVGPGATKITESENIPEAVYGKNTESAIPNEGKATFDIVFTVLLKNKERQKIYIDVEAQKEFHPGYDLTTRGIYYPARLLSAQADTEFTGEDYDNIKKVYSIWICMNAPNITKDEKRQVADAIVKYSIKPEVVYVDGNPEDVYIGRYDLFTSFFIHLRADETETSKNKLIGMLTVLLSIKKSTSEKKAILENDYGMKMSKEVEKEVDGMCNLSDLIEEQANIKAIVKMLKYGMPEEEILKDYTKEELAQAKLLRDQQQTAIV